MELLFPLIEGTIPSGNDTLHAKTAVIVRPKGIRYTVPYIFSGETQHSPTSSSCDHRIPCNMHRRGYHTPCKFKYYPNRPLILYRRVPSLSEQHVAPT